MTDKKYPKPQQEDFITSNDLEYILDVNKKSIEINLEVEKQNEQVIAKLDDLIELQQESRLEQQEIKLEQKNIITKMGETNEFIKIIINKKIEKIEKDLFKLVILLGSMGVGAIITIIQSLFHK